MKIQSSLSILTAMSLVVLLTLMTLAPVRSAAVAHPPLGLEQNHRFLMAKISRNKTPERNGRIAAKGLKSLSDVKIKIERIEIESRQTGPSASGGFGADHLPVAVKVTVFSKKRIRHRIIASALNRLRRRPDFESVFISDADGVQIRRVNNRKFIVIIRFNRDYQEIV